MNEQKLLKDALEASEIVELKFDDLSLVGGGKVVCFPGDCPEPEPAGDYPVPAPSDPKTA